VLTVPAPACLRKRPLSALLVLLAAGLAGPARAGGADFVWIEGESLARRPAGFKVGGWGNKHYLSGESWLFAAIDGKDAEALPAEGLTLRFPFELRSAGDHEVWARVGYEFVRSPFRWRIDAGSWGEDGPEHLTTDLMDLAEWTEVAWVKLGTARLAPDRHTLHIHFARRVLPGKKQPERILAGLDCFCISKDPFRPNGPHKPRESWQQAGDREAARQTFAVPAEAATRPRTVLSLKGFWQIARWDEQEIKDRAEPVRELPAGHDRLFWKGVRVPGNRDTARPDLLYCHRFLYRTRLHVPAGLAGRSFVLRFPSTALIASVFVNGRYCGGSTAPCAAWEADCTGAVRPGADNEVVVAVKDCYYAVAQTGEGKSVRYLFNFPVSWFYSGGGLGPTRFADFPVLLKVPAAGILETPALTVAGPAYTADVFAKPSVAPRELALDITVHNSTARPLQVKVENEVVPLKGGPAEKTFAAREVIVPAGADSVFSLAEKWDNPRLWWPDDPQLYEVVTRLSAGGKVVDERRTRFGFREWGWKGRHFTLNGVPWHFRADLLHNGKIEAKDRAKVVADWKRSGVNMVRYWGQEPWVGESQEETLDFFDRIGMPVRRSGLFDGEAASYQLVESKGGKTVPRKAVFDHWIEQLRAWVKAERNHPSVFVWSVENEITYINLRNFGLLEVCEPEIRRAVRAVMALDPTRPAMIDGGDALRDRSLPVYGNHYNEANFREYPDEARTMALAFSRHRTDPRANPWPVGDDRPLFLGESFFANGFPPAAYSALIGEAAFLGRNQAEPGVYLFARMLAEGYRWHGLAGFHFWFAGDGPDNYHYKAFQPVCVFVKEWNGTFAGGRRVERTLKVFNDTRFAEPIYLNYAFHVAGKKRGRGGAELTIPPGGAQELTISFTMPRVAVRTPAELVLVLRRGDKEVFRDVKPCVLLGPEPVLPKVAGDDLILFDPKGKVGPWLKQRGYPFREVASLDDLPSKLKLLVVGPDALTPRQATDPRWVALAAAGARVLMLDQDNPLHYQALPADLEPTPPTGRIGFPENLEHPAFDGLGKEDFFCWSGDHVVYRNAYKKALRGARSLLQCDDELSCTALAECPVQGGLLVVSQAAVGSRLDSDPVAGRLFDNLLRYCLGYRPVAKTTVAVLPEGDLRLKLLDGIGLRYRRAGDVRAALADPKADIVVADASPANLRALASAPEPLQAFTGRGGYLMLWGLTPEGLADFNKVVGLHHVLRPFRLERVTLPAVRDPLLAGLTARDVVLESTERIYPWSGDRYPANDTFTYVVDLDDIAPFARSDRYAHGWSQMTNGLTSADSWKFIFYHELKNDPHPKWSAELPHEEEVEAFSIILNTHYQVITKLRLLFDGREEDAVTLDLRPAAELRQDFKLSPPRKCRRITLEPMAFDTRGKQPTTGVDNIWIKVKRGRRYQREVVPLLNIGALVKYRLVKGGVILNELRVSASEPNPVNGEKKQAIVAALLRNLGAAFASGRTLVAGYNLKYTPVPLDEKCTQYLTRDRGWLDTPGDLRRLPVGAQKLAGVDYFVRDFKTSPLPACIMLAGPGARGAMPAAVRDIPVGRKADLLFFLHTFHRTKEWRPSDKDRVPPAVFRYVIHYDDGRTTQVPVRYERGVGHWVAERPQGRPEAAVAWAAPLPGDPGRQAVVYQMSWPNPRPGVPIRSIDVCYDERVGNGYGVPVVLAITAARAGH
jgi:beta-galactosidase